MFEGILLIIECHNYHKHCQCPLTSYLDLFGLNSSGSRYCQFLVRYVGFKAF